MGRNCGILRYTYCQQSRIYRNGSNEVGDPRIIAGTNHTPDPVGILWFIQELEYLEYRLILVMKLLLVCMPFVCTNDVYIDL